MSNEGNFYIHVTNFRNHVYQLKQAYSNYNKNYEQFLDICSKMDQKWNDNLTTAFLGMISKEWLNKYQNEIPCVIIQIIDMILIYLINIQALHSNKNKYFKRNFYRINAYLNYLNFWLFLNLFFILLFQT